MEKDKRLMEASWWQRLTEGESGSWKLDYKESWALKNWCFELWCWRRLPWSARISNQSILKEISPEFIGRTDAKAETPILWPPDSKNWLIWKDPDVGKDWRWEEKGTAEDEMVGWHHWLNGHELEQAPGVGDGREAWCAAVHGGHKESDTRCAAIHRGHKGSDTTEQLNWTKVVSLKNQIMNWYCLIGVNVIRHSPYSRISECHVQQIHWSALNNSLALLLFC